MLKVNVIGAGRLGTALALLFSRSSKYRINDICNRSLSSAREAVAIVGAGSAKETIGQMSSAEVWLLSVADSEIKEVSEQLATRSALRSGDIVFHASGVLGSEVLSSLQSRGAAIGSLHPVRSFSDPRAAAENFGGTLCAVEGDDKAAEVLTTLSVDLGGKPFRLAAADKALYHAALVFSSNYIVTCLETASRLLSSSSLSPDLVVQMICSIAAGTVANVEENGTFGALTGPIARGDFETVGAHLSAGMSPDQLLLYRVLGAATVPIAEHAGGATREKLKVITSLLEP